ncbi:hypothetical protein X772_13730 [Mesorhizobium sp. LSJC280B00]|nr:hypothetical protein X772_13730 [Mesorhizobium sp. LSJC280B00]
MPLNRTRDRIDPQAVGGPECLIRSDQTDRRTQAMPDLVGYNYLRRGNQLIRISAWEREYLGRSLMITLSLAFLDIAAPLG